MTFSASSGNRQALKTAVSAAALAVGCTIAAPAMAQQPLLQSEESPFANSMNAPVFQVSNAPQDVTVDGTEDETVDVGPGETLTVTADGSISVDDGDAVEVDGDGATINNDGTISSSDGRAIDARGVDNTVIINNGTISSTDSDVIDVSGSDGVTITNTGTILGDVTDVKGIDGGDNLTVTNSGIIRVTNGEGKGIEGDENLTVMNMEGGLIEALGQGAEAVEADGAGLVLVNAGTIRSEFDDAVDGDDNVDITNSGLIEGNANDAIELNSGTITNSGTIISLSSDPEGTPSTIGGPPELDAAIDFDAGTPGNEDGTVTNLAGGLIEGDIGIVASPGNVGNSTPNRGAQTVINNGTIRGRMGTAVALGFGDDTFEQQEQGVVDGIVDGGDGFDTARIGGAFDSDFLINFEQISFANAVIGGMRTVTGDVTIDGPVTFNLTTDNLLVDGDLTLENSAVVNVTTNFDITTVLTGQPIAIVDETGTFTDNGVTVNVIDDDLLLDFDVDVGSILITPQAANPGANSADGNVLLLGNTLQAALVLRSLDPTFANQINDLGSLAAFETAANGLLPSLSTGISREIFESSNMGSRFLDQRIAEKGSGIWGQFGYRASDRDTRSTTVSGYDADSFTFALGADTHVSDTFILGIAGVYSNIDIGETNGSNENIDIDSYKISLYGGLNFTDQFYVNGEVGYSFSDVDTARTALTGPVQGAFNVDGYVARVEAGYIIETSENFSLTPTLGLNYMYLDFDEYTEFGGLALGVTRDEVQFWEGRIGLTANADFDKLKGLLRVVYAYDFDADARVAQLTLFNAPSFVVSSDTPAEGRFEVDAGFGYDLSDMARIDLSYTGEFADEFTSHGGLVRLRFGF
ncbi:MAG: autotransporter domain-containing protein [Pseudomonadota bacterium]